MMRLAQQLPCQRAELSRAAACAPSLRLRPAVRVCATHGSRSLDAGNSNVSHAAAAAVVPTPAAAALQQGGGKATRQPQQQLWKAAAAVAAVAAITCCLPAAAQAASDAQGGSLMSSLISFVLHLDKHLSAMIQQHGTTTYVILWTIVFCETGLVLTPFLPGDSLLFAAGAFAGLGQLSLPILAAVFITSAVLGDAVNYAIGNKLGSWALQRKLLNPQHIAQTEKFYAKYGGKTVVLARFVPIVRTFAPFVAGIGSMAYSKFAMYNVLGALIWTVLFVGAGFFFGNLPVVQKNFTLVVLGIVVVSVIPVLLELRAAAQEAKHNKGGGSSPGAAAA